MGCQQTRPHRIWYSQAPDHACRWFVICFQRASGVDLIKNTEDELVSLDDLQEKLGEFEDYVQSSDVAAMQSKR